MNVDKIVKEGITEDWVKKNKDFLAIYSILMEKKNCIMCKYKHKGWNDLDFHLKSTHGIPSLYELIIIYLESK